MMNNEVSVVGAERADEELLSVACEGLEDAERQEVYATYRAADVTAALRDARRYRAGWYLRVYCEYEDCEVLMGTPHWYGSEAEAQAAADLVYVRGRQYVRAAIEKIEE
jgi:hypothetical protein